MDYSISFKNKAVLMILPYPFTDYCSFSIIPDMGDLSFLFLLGQSGYKSIDFIDLFKESALISFHFHCFSDFYFIDYFSLICSFALVFYGENFNDLRTFFLLNVVFTAINFSLSTTSAAFWKFTYIVFLFFPFKIR